MRIEIIPPPTYSRWKMLNKENKGKVGISTHFQFFNPELDGLYVCAENKAPQLFQLLFSFSQPNPDMV